MMKPDAPISFVYHICSEEPIPSVDTQHTNHSVYVDIYSLPHQLYHPLW